MISPCLCLLPKLLTINQALILCKEVEREEENSTAAFFPTRKRNRRQGWKLNLTDDCAKYATSYFSWKMSSKGGREPDPPPTLSEALVSDVQAASETLEKALFNTRGYMYY